MSDVILKYPLILVQEQSVLLPLNAEALSVTVQNEQPMLHARVLDTNPPVMRRVLTAFTGQPLWNTNPKMRFVGTYQLGNGALVGHVFIEGENAS